MKKFDIKMKKRIAYLGAALAVQFGVLPWSVEAAVANDALPVLGTTGSIHKTNGSTPDAIFFQGTMGADGKFTPGTQTVNGKIYSVMGIKQDEDVRVGLINWESFNVGRDAMVNIKQYKSSDIMINNVKSNNLSQIAGTINATGNVVIINPNGVVFDGAKINVGGFVVSTAPLLKEPGDGEAVKYALSQNSLTQGNIEIKDTLIRAGYSAVINNTTALQLPNDFAYDFNNLNNTINVVANGDVILNKAKLIATDSATIQNTRNVGIEEWGLADATDGFSGTIAIRTDANSDDYGKLEIVGTKNDNWLIAPTVSAYYNPELAKIQITDEQGNVIKDSNDKPVTKQVLGYTDDDRLYTKKDFTKEIDLKTMVTTRLPENQQMAFQGYHYIVKDGDIYEYTKDEEGKDIAVLNLKKDASGNPIIINGTDNPSAYMLINNIAQLQDIDDPTFGNLKGHYALGKDVINATNDSTGYVEEINGSSYVHKTAKIGGTNTSIISVSDGYFTKNQDAIEKTLNDGTKVTYVKNGDSYNLVNGEASITANTGDGTNAFIATGFGYDTGENGQHYIQDSTLFTIENGKLSYVTLNAEGLPADSGSTYNMDTAEAKAINGGLKAEPVTQDGNVYSYTFKSADNSVTYIAEYTIEGEQRTLNGINYVIGEESKVINDAMVTRMINTAVTKLENPSTKPADINGISGDLHTTQTVSMYDSTGASVKYSLYTTNVDNTATYVSYKANDEIGFLKNAGADNAVSVLLKNIESIDISGNETSAPKLQTLDRDKVVNYNYNKDGSVTYDEGETTFSAKDERLTSLAGMINAYQQIRDLDAAEAAADKSLTAIKFDNNPNASKDSEKGLIKIENRQTIFEGSTSMNSSEWWKKTPGDVTPVEYAAFNPVGKRKTSYTEDSDNNKFTGVLTGTNGLNGPRGSSTITNLTIYRPNEDNVGLFTVMDGGNVNYVNFNSADIKGGSNVGTVAGSMEGNSHIGAVSVDDNSTVRGGTSYKGRAPVHSGADTDPEENYARNIGGLVGEMVGTSTISWSTNKADVNGYCDTHESALENGTPIAEIDVKNIGGIVGYIKGDNSNSNEGNPSISTTNNYGNVTGEQGVGGIAGYAENANIGGDRGDYVLTRVSNSGIVTGDIYVGGLIGDAEGNIHLSNAFNSNQKSVTPQGTVITGNHSEIKDKVNTEQGDDSFNDDYGYVQGVNFVGGIVGHMNGNNNVLEQVYNAANIKGKNNVGGIAGNLTGNSTITNSYNSDNNTVIHETLPAFDATDMTESFEEILNADAVKELIPYYTEADDKDKPAIKASIQYLTEYYSFYTIENETENKRTYYYYIPASVENDSSRQGAAGSYFYLKDNEYVKLPETSTSEGPSLESIALSQRYYANRVAYRDANVIGENNVGGLVGLQEGGSIGISYNAGSIKPTSTTSSITNAGGLVGLQDFKTESPVDYKPIANSFYVIGSDLSTGKSFSGRECAVGGKVVSNDGEETVVPVADTTDTKSKEIISARSGEAIAAGFEDGALAYFEKIDKIDNKGYKIYEANNTPIYYVADETSDQALADALTALGITKYSIYQNEGGTSSYVVIPAGTKDSSGHDLTADFAATFAEIKSFKDSSTRESVTSFEWATETEAGKTIYKPTSGLTSVTSKVASIVSNQSDVWTVYGDQTLPLLNVFMGPAGLEREFFYDGTVHNLVTDDEDVKGLYGRADFSNGAGKDVYTSGYDNIAANGISSTYYYNTSSVWAPQHGWRTDPSTSVIIKPVTINIDIHATKIYGEKFDSTGTNYAIYYDDPATKTNNYINITGQGKDVAQKENIFGLVGDTDVITIANTIDSVDPSLEYLNVNRYNGNQIEIGAGEYETGTIYGTNLLFVNDLNTAVLKKNYNLEFVSTLNNVKRTVTIDTIGERVYGDNLNNSTLEYHIEKAANDAITGIKAGDIAKLGNLEAYEETDSKVTLKAEKNTSGIVIQTADSSSKSLDVGVYDKNNGANTYLTSSFVTAGNTNGAYLNQNYSIVKGDNELTITPAELFVKIIGSKTYGDEDAADGTGYKIEAEGLKNKEVFDNLEVTFTDETTNTSKAATSKKATDATGISNGVHDLDNVDYSRNTYLDVGQYTSIYGAENDVYTVTKALADGSSSTLEYAKNPNDGKYYLKTASGLDTSSEFTDTIGITNWPGLSVADHTGDDGSKQLDGFNVANYNIHTVYDYTVTEKPLDIIIYGEKSYGQNTSSSSDDYSVDYGKKFEYDNEYTLAGITPIEATPANGLANTETINFTELVVNNIAVDEDGHGKGAQDVRLDAGTYYGYKTSGATTGVDNALFIDETHLTGNLGFKATNYNISQTSRYSVTPVGMDLIITGNKVYGENTGTSGSAVTSSNKALTEGKQYTFEISGLKNNETINGIGGENKGAIEGLTGLVNRAVDDDGEGYVNNALYRDTYLDAGMYVSSTNPAQTGAKVIADLITVDANSLQAAAGEGGFKANNYFINEIVSTYEVEKSEAAKVEIVGTSVYGQGVATTGDAYTVKISGLQDGETIGSLGNTNTFVQGELSWNMLNNLTDGDVAPYNAEKFLDVDKYHAQATGTNVTSKDDLVYISNIDDSITKNYNVVQESTYTVTPTKLNADIVGEKTYGDPTSTSGNDYKITMTGLVNGEAIGGIGNNSQGKLPNVVIDNTLSPQGTYLNVNVDANGNVIAYEDVLTVRASELGKYNSADTNGFKIDNYELDSEGDYTVKRRPVDVNITGSKIFGTDTSTDGKDYNIYINGLVNGDKLGGLGNHTGVGTGAPVYHYGDTAIDSTGGKNLPVGSYFNTITLDGIEIVNGVYQTRNYTINSTSTYRVDPNKDPEAESNHTLGHGGDRKPVMLDIVYLDVQGSGIAVDMSNLSVPTVDASEAVAPVELATSNIPAANANVVPEALAKDVDVQATDAKNTVSDDEEQRRKKAAK